MLVHALTQRGGLRQQPEHQLHGRLPPARAIRAASSTRTSARSVAKKGILPITPTPPERLRPDGCPEGERNALVVPPDDAAAQLAHFPQFGAGAENGTSAPLRCE